MFVLTTPFPPEVDALAALPGVTELLVAHRDLARLGRLDDGGCTDLARAARALGKRVVLVWDLLCGDGAIADGGALIGRLGPALFDAIRVQDPGVALYVKERFPDLGLQLVLETGNHNTEGILAWEARFAPERLVLSNELPLDQLAALRWVKKNIAAFGWSVTAITR